VRGSLLRCWWTNRWPRASRQPSGRVRCRKQGCACTPRHQGQRPARRGRIQGSPSGAPLIAHHARIPGSGSEGLSFLPGVVPLDPSHLEGVLLIEVRAPELLGLPVLAVLTPATNRVE